MIPFMQLFFVIVAQMAEMELQTMQRRVEMANISFTEKITVVIVKVKSLNHSWDVPYGVS